MIQAHLTTRANLLELHLQNVRVCAPESAFWTTDAARELQPDRLGFSRSECGKYVSHRELPLVHWKQSSKRRLCIDRGDVLMYVCCAHPFALEVTHVDQTTHSTMSSQPHPTRRHVVELRNGDGLVTVGQSFTIHVRPSDTSVAVNVDVFMEVVPAVARGLLAVMDKDEHWTTFS